MKKVFVVFFIVFSGSTFCQKVANLNQIGHWESLDSSGNPFENNRYNDVWGFAQNNHEFAVIGDVNGTHFIDVTDSTDIKEVAFVEGSYRSLSVVHRDFKRYKNYIYAVCDEGKGLSTLQIIDTKYLPDRVRVVYDSKELFSTSHNLFIDTSSQTMYACNQDGLYVYSLISAIDPQLRSVYTSDFVHDLYVRNDTAFLNCASGGLVVVDFSDITNPKRLFAMREYKDQGYNHSGWLSEDGKIYVFADETYDTRVKVCDVSNLQNIEILSLIPSPGDSSIPHNLLIKNDLLYISYYSHGVLVYDIKDPSNPVKLAKFVLENDNRWMFNGVWGVYPFLPSGKILISDIGRGLYVLELDKKEALNLKQVQFRKEANVIIHPNPFKEKIKLKFQTTSNEDCLLKLFDVQGKEIGVIFEGKTHESEVEISTSDFSLKAGVYYVIGYTGSCFVHEKILNK